MAARAIRTPTVIDDGDGRLPAPAVVAHIKPTAIRRQGIVKVSDRLWLCINDGGLLFHDNRLRRRLLNDDLLLIGNVILRDFNRLPLWRGRATHPPRGAS